MTAPKERLFFTFKDEIFDFLEKHPDVTEGRVLRSHFPDAKKSTLYLYLKEWKLSRKHEAELKNYIKDIYTMIHVLKYKMMYEKQWSAEEQKSFERLGELLEKYRDLWEEPSPIPKKTPEAKPKRKKLKSKNLLKLDFNGD